MKIVILRECGYDETAYGFGLSKRPPGQEVNIERMKQILPKYAFGKPGENKFLEMIYVWVSIDASRDFWSQMDTYRHKSMQSESTMYGLKTELTPDDFEDQVIDPDYLVKLNEKIRTQKTKHDKRIIKKMLPEGFMQERLLCMNYRELQVIVMQRTGHDMLEWTTFIETILANVQHPEFLWREE